MRNLKLTIAYDGTEFHGWQAQPGLSTVQGELESALARLFNHEVAVNGSGRTDAGVHAHGQVANVQTIRTMDTGAVLKGSNGLLPIRHSCAGSRRCRRILSCEDVGALQRHTNTISGGNISSVHSNVVTFTNIPMP